MAENENRVSAVQEAPDSPQEPAALDTPPSEMPVYEPARPVRRVGTLTMGLALVVVGAALCVGLFFPNVDFLLLFKLSPLVLVALGCEVIFAASTAKGMRLKYDFLSMFVCFLLIVTALGAACVPVALQYAGPGRSAAEQRVEQELYEATYARLKGNGDIVNVTYDVHLGELRTPEDVTGAADLKAGDYVGVSAELKGTWATREEFVAACRPVIEAVRAIGAFAFAQAAARAGRVVADKLEFRSDISRNHVASTPSISLTMTGSPPRGAQMRSGFGSTARMALSSLAT